MNYWKNGIWIILLLFIAAGGTGCALFIVAGAGAAVGIGTAEYIGGELKQAYAAPMEKTWNASIATADELKMKTTFCLVRFFLKMFSANGERLNSLIFHFTAILGASLRLILGTLRGRKLP